MAANQKVVPGDGQSYDYRWFYSLNTLHSAQFQPHHPNVVHGRNDSDLSGARVWLQLL